MLSAALRVLARSAAIQREEAAARTTTVAARTAAATATATAAARTAAATPARPSGQHGQWPNAKTLDAPPASHGAALAALDRLIDAAPHQPPPPAPRTHPEDKSQPESVKPAESVKPVETTRKTSIVKEQAVGDAAAAVKNGQAEPLIAPVDEEETPVILRASRVPASRLGRLFHYGCELHVKKIAHKSLTDS